MNNYATRLRAYANSLSSLAIADRALFNDAAQELDRLTRITGARREAQAPDDGTCKHGWMGGECDICNPDLFKDTK